MSTFALAVKNLKGRPGRTTALTLLAMILSFSVFSSSILTGSLNRGLSSLSDRLGADIMVVPYEAASRSSLESIILQGNKGYFYMDSSVYDRISGMEGVERVTSQLFLASVSNAGCCSLPVQIIGFDPESDFTVIPWIKKSGGGEIGDYSVVIGNDLTAFVGDTLKFYDVPVTVAAKLDKTGTGLDTAVYTNINTLKALMQASIDKGLNTFKNLKPDSSVSCVLIKVADGYSVDEVLNDINIHVRKVEAVKTANMISNVNGSLEGVSLVINVFSIALWLISALILVAAIVISISSRKKEFALMRSFGTPARLIKSIVRSEAVMVGVVGGLLGVLLGLSMVVLFNGLIEQALSLPFLMPGVIIIFITALLSVALVCVIGFISASVGAGSFWKKDPGIYLREE